MNVFQINTSDLRFKAFEQFFVSHPDSHFFQSGRLYSFIEGLKNYEPLLLVCEDESGKIRGSLLAIVQSNNHPVLKYFSSGAIIRGGPLLDHSFNDKICVLQDLLEVLIKSTKERTLVIQFRNFFNQEPYLETFKKFRFVFHDHLNLIISTQNKASVLSGISKSRQRQISKSIKNGAVVIENPSFEQYLQFYNLLKSIYNSKIHKPLPSWSFFERFFYNLVAEHVGMVQLVGFNGKIIGGILCPVSEGKAIHEWYVCGLDRQYSARGIYPSVLATWSGMEYAIKMNIPFFDFMGMGDPNTPYGVRDFKLRFGGEPVNYGRFNRINNFPVYSVANLGYKIIVRVQLFLSKSFQNRKLG